MRLNLIGFHYVYTRFMTETNLVCTLFVTGNVYVNKLYEPLHEISNNLVCETSKASDQPAHTRSLIRAFASRLNILLTEHNLEFLSLKGGCTGSSESTLVIL